MSSSDLDFSTMSREVLLKSSRKVRQEYLEQLQCRHRNLEAAATDVMELLEPGSLVNILPVIGATGSGKTTLLSRLIRSLIVKQGDKSKTCTDIPFLYVEIGANGSRSLSWIDLYEDILRAGAEILIEKKCERVVCKGILRLISRRSKKIGPLRSAIESMFKHRRVRVLVLDEAFHLLRFGNYTSVMDTLKSIANKTGVRIVLLGTYDLFDLVTDYGQVARRGETVHLQRYFRDRPEDVEEFRKNIIKKIQDRWPCEEVPNFCAIAEELMEASLGCVGLLKAILAKSLILQNKNKGAWNPLFLAKATKSVKVITKIRKEIESGENKVKDGCYRESFFSPSALAAISQKMSHDDSRAARGISA